MLLSAVVIPLSTSNIHFGSKVMTRPQVGEASLTLIAIIPTSPLIRVINLIGLGAQDSMDPSKISAVATVRAEAVLETLISSRHM